MSLLVTQLINLFAAVILMLAFAMITQRRILSLIHLFTLQGAALRDHREGQHQDDRREQVDQLGDEEAHRRFP